MLIKAKYALYNEDAFGWLARCGRDTIHAVVTDPPYAIREFLQVELDKRKNGSGGVWRVPNRFDGRARAATPRFTSLGPADRDRLRDFHTRLSTELVRCLVPGGHVIMASHMLLSYIVVAAFVDSGFELRGQIARVVKTLLGGDRPKGAHEEFKDLSVSPRSCWEPWLVFRRPVEGRVSDNLRKWGTGALRRSSRSSPFQDLIECAPARGLEKVIAAHPSLKPQALMREIVRAAVPLGTGQLLDPFMGSGSTIAAASALGVPSVGIESNSEYFKMAQRAIPLLADWPDLTQALDTPMKGTRK